MSEVRLVINNLTIKDTMSNDLKSIPRIIAIAEDLHHLWYILDFEIVQLHLNLLTIFSLCFGFLACYFSCTCCLLGIDDSSQDGKGPIGFFQVQYLRGAIRNRV